METILTLNKDYSNQAINLLFRGKVAREIIQATIHKMILLSEYDYFFDLQDKYNVTVTVNELDDKFYIVINTDDDYIVLSLSELEVVTVF